MTAIGRTLPALASCTTGGIDVEAMQRQIREQFAPGGTAAPDLSAFFPTAAAAEDPVDKLADFSSRGKQVDFIAPGVDVDAEVSRMGDPVPPIFWFRDPSGHTLMVVENPKEG